MHNTTKESDELGGRSNVSTLWECHAKSIWLLCTWCNPTIFPIIYEGISKSSPMHTTGLDNDIKFDIFGNCGRKSPLNIKKDVIEGVLEIVVL